MNTERISNIFIFYNHYKRYSATVTVQVYIIIQVKILYHVTPSWWPLDPSGSDNILVWPFKSKCFGAFFASLSLLKSHVLSPGQPTLSVALRKSRHLTWFYKYIVIIFPETNNCNIYVEVVLRHCCVTSSDSCAFLTKTKWRVCLQNALNPTIKFWDNQLFIFLWQRFLMRNGIFMGASQWDAATFY